MKNTAYILKWDTGHSEDPGYDAFLWNERQYLESFSRFKMSVEEHAKWQWKLPKLAYFQANFDMIPKYDYPYTNIMLPIVSKKMLNILLGLAPFEYSAIPIIMIDFTYLEPPFDEHGNLKSEAPINMDYIALYLPNLLNNVFDYEKSIYRSSISGDFLIIRRFNLKEPKNNFPPIFKIKEDFNNIFVSHEAKEALIAHGIKGCVFEPVEVTPYDAEQ